MPAHKKAPKPCAFGACVRDAYARGYCHAHYQQRRKGQILKPLRRMRKHVDSSARNSAGMKQCLDCMCWLDVVEFSRHKSYADELQPICKDCNSWLHRLRKYGMSKERFEELLVEQGGLCPVCDTPEPGVSGWHIDHDHACCDRKGSCGNCIRALLCGPCNQGLGLFRDNAERLRKAADYIDRHTTTKGA